MTNNYTPSCPSTWRRWTFEAVDIHSDNANFGNKKWSIVSAQNKEEALYKINDWMSTNPGWDNYWLIPESVKLDPKRVAQRKTDDMYETGDFWTK